MNFIDETFNSAFNTAFEITAKTATGLFSGAFKLTRRALQNRKFSKKIQQALDKSCMNRKVAAAPNINTDAIYLNDDPEYDDVAEFNLSAIDYIFGRNDEPESMIISGGTNQKRLRALEIFINKSQTKKMPVVVLHSSNSDIYNMIKANSYESEFISSKNGDNFYDVFAGIKPSDIVKLLYDTIDNKTERGLEALLESLVNVALDKFPRLSMQELAYFPIDDIENEINLLCSQGLMDEGRKNSLLSSYYAGTAAKNALSFSLKDLAVQFERTFGAKRTSSSSVKRMINRKGVIAIDVGNAHNELAVKFMIKHLILLDTVMKIKNPAFEFNVVVDNIPIYKINAIRDLLRYKTYAITCSDFVASMAGSDVLFNSIASGVGLIVLLRHSGLSSCKKWSDYLGKYRKITMQNDISENGTFLNFTSGRHLHVDEEDKPRIKDLTIANLPDDVACVYRSEEILIANI